MLDQVPRRRRRELPAHDNQHLWQPDLYARKRVAREHGTGLFDGAALRLAGQPGRYVDDHDPGDGLVRRIAIDGYADLYREGAADADGRGKLHLRELIAGSTSFPASGLQGTAVWSASGLPDGLYISSTGVVSGTATVPGTYPARITVRDTFDDRTIQKDTTFVVTPTAMMQVPSTGSIYLYDQTSASPGMCRPIVVNNIGSLDGANVTYSISSTAMQFCLVPDQCSSDVPAKSSCSVGLQLNRPTNGTTNATLTVRAGNGTTATAAIIGVRR